MIKVASPERTLEVYRTKRDFTRTREPSGKSASRASRGELAFVVQKHAASHLHFDLRLELDGVMKSWAVPKGPSLDPRDKRLAMQVEDHPIDYNKFEGTIPKGEYGGGTVMIWDRGTYEPDDGKSSIAAGLKAGQVKFTLHGEKLQGSYALVRMARGDGRQWLLIKHADAFAAHRQIVSDRDKSVVSSRTMKQIAEGKESATWHSNKNGKSSAKVSAKPRPRSTTNTRTDPSIAPMLATSAAEMPMGDGWEFEPKYDGIRILAIATADDTRLITRNGIDKSSQFPEITEALRSLSKRRRTSLVLDGEIVALDGAKYGRFQALQGRVHERDAGTIAHALSSRPVVMVLFDILMRGDRPLASESWTTRRKALEAVARDLGEGALRLGEAEVGDGQALLRRAEEEGWEGLMAKRTESPYAAGKRSRDWLKIKLENQQEFVVGGWTEPRNSRQHFGALLIGYWSGEKFMYAGHVGGGFSDARLGEVFTRLRSLERNTSPFEGKPATNQPAHWVKPELVVEVKFNEWTNGGLLRQPIFLGLRDDKDAAQVTRERAKAASRRSARGVASNSATNVALEPGEGADDVRATLTTIEEGRGDGDVIVGSNRLHVTNLTKTYFRKARKTKGDVLRYYDRIGELILPHLADRPLVLRRYPDGVDKPAFFQQRAPDDTPEGVRTETVATAEKGDELRIVGGDLTTLLYCAQLGGIDMNPWHSRIDSLGDADYSILDLDPGPRAPFSRVVEVARVVHEVLDAFGLYAAIKTSGASGIHVVVPLPPRTSYQSSLLLAQVVATETANALPKYATVVRKVSDRGPGQVYVDYLQNVQGKSVASVLSLRARPLASVSMPIAFEELNGKLKPGDFTIDTPTDEASARMQGYAELLAHPVDLSVFTAAV